MNGIMDCKHARLQIGGDPRTLSAEVAQHIATCAACAKFRDETLAMESRLKAALELPLHHFRETPKKAAPRRLALAASVVLALLVGGGAWLFRPAPALAEDLVEHIQEEAGSWQTHDPVQPELLAGVLAKAGVKYDSRLPVSYASPCPFHGHIVPHLVVQTDRGPLTVIVLAHESVKSKVTFSEGGYHGVLLPAGEGGIAVLAPRGQDYEGAVETVLEGVR
jgi:hypothetical protein